MLDVTIGGIRCKISLLFPAVFLCLLQMDPSGLALFGFLAAILHESGHMLVLLLLREKPRALTVSCFGMCITTDPARLRTTAADVLLYGGGPLVNIVCAVLLSVARMPSVYSGIHGILAAMNLLPILPLDGGQIARRLLVAFGDPVRVNSRMDCLFRMMFVPLSALGFMLWRHTGNFTLLLTAGYIGFVKLFYKGN